MTVTIGELRANRQKSIPIFVKEHVWIALQSLPPAEFGEDTGPFEYVSAAIHKYRVLRGSPDQISAVDILIQHPSRKMIGLDELYRLYRARLLDLLCECR